MEVVLADVLCEVFVGGDAGGFEGLGGDLFALLRDDVDDEGEGVDRGALAAHVVDADLGVGDAAVVAGLWVGLATAEPVASGWSSSH